VQFSYPWTGNKCADLHKQFSLQTNVVKVVKWPYTNKNSVTFQGITLKEQPFTLLKYDTSDKILCCVVTTNYCLSDAAFNVGNCNYKGKKVNLSLFNKAPRHEDVLGEWRYSFIHPLSLALDGGEWSASRPDRFTPQRKNPGTHWIGGWVGPRAGLDVVSKRKKSHTPPGIKPRSSSP
jgi:hypothetical protein